MFEPFARAEQRRWGGVHLRGLLLDGQRKSVEPMAARLGEDGNRQALAHFITSSPWDPAHVRARLARQTQPAIKPTGLVVDDTGFRKDGDASACVARQSPPSAARREVPPGTAGKVTDCQAGVSLQLASDHASAAIDWRLFLPRSWDPASPQADPAKVARRARCGIAGAHKSSAQAMNLIRTTGHPWSRRPTSCSRTLDERHHDLSCCCAWPTLP